MPYIYSNHGLSIRWEDDPYVATDGEIANDVFIAPPEQLHEQSGPLLPHPEVLHPAPSLEARLAILEARVEQFLRIAIGITTATTRP